MERVTQGASGTPAGKCYIVHKNGCKDHVYFSAQYIVKKS
jgi:hypothetical protein